MTDERKRKRRIRACAIGVGALAVAGVVALGLANYFAPFRDSLPPEQIAARGEGEMRLHFLDVGQADCTVVEFPDGKTLVVDAGSSSRESEDKICSYLEGLGSPTLTLIATHADSDHYGGFTRILERFDVEAVYMPLIGAETEEYAAFREKAEAEGCPIDVLTRYDAIEGGGAYAVCISPRSVETADENDSSCVLYLSYAGVRTVLAGDISGDRERLLVTEYGFMEGLFDKDGRTVRLEEIDLLKAAHHGASDSTSAEWLELLRPKSAIISCGRGNSYGHPAPDTLTRLSAMGSEVYRTDVQGDIMVTISAGGEYTFGTER